ncbi:MAG TPA: transposase, partial [Polyangiaceae bacterium]|nr:transposase [Polyangiaceae bacterium]
GIQDLASNKILAWRVDRTENADLVRLTFGDAIEQWGIPDHVYQDNGRAFAAKWLTGHTPNRYRYKVRDEDPRGVLVELGVQVHWTTPYHGQSKPIERAWRDLCANLSRHPAFEGAYLGSDTTRKPHNSGTRVVELEEFLRVADVMIREHNARRGRRASVTPNGESFDQVFLDSYERRTIRKLTEAQRRFLWLAVDGVTIRATGEIHLWENRYWSVALTQLRDRKVTVRFDPQALHKGIHVYRLDGSYVGFCDCVEKSGFASRDAGREQARKRRAYVKAQKQLASAQQLVDPATINDLHMSARGAPERAAAGAVAPVFKLPKAPPVPVERTKKEQRQRDDDADYIINLGRESGKALKRRVI